MRLSNSIAPLLFLDIDGVMNTTESCLRHRSGEVFVPEAVSALRWLILHSEAQVVITSTRRRAGLAAMRNLFQLNGLGEPEAPPTDAMRTFIGTTPLLTSADVDDFREDEILAWMDASGYRGPYAVIDDKPLSAPLSLRQVLTDPEIGLTLPLARRAARMLAE